MELDTPKIGGMKKKWYWMEWGFVLLHSISLIYVYKTNQLNMVLSRSTPPFFIN